MALIRVSTNGIADDAVDNTKLDLADNYAFTGTVTGASEGVGNVEAWANIDGTGTVSVRDSGNVSSVTDLATGRYQVNFTTAFADTNYAFTWGTDRADALGGANGGMLTTSVEIRTRDATNTDKDTNNVCVAIIR